MEFSWSVFFPIRTEYGEIVRNLVTRFIFPRKSLIVGSFIEVFELFNEGKKDNSIHLTAKNTQISPKFLAWKFCGKTQFPQSFGRFTNCAFPQNFNTMKLGIVRSKTVAFKLHILRIDRSQNE